MAKEIEPTWLQALFLWQGLQDDYRTYCGVICFSEERVNVDFDQDL